MRRVQALFRGPSAAVAVAVLTLALGGGVVRGQSTYYVRPGGDDQRDGKSPVAAWRTVGRVNAQALGAGDRVLFERAGEWRERLVPARGGATGRPVVFGAYGGGAKPKFWGSDVLEKGGFRPDAGGAFRVGVAAVVHAVLVDHRFLRHAGAAAKGGLAAEAEHVRSHPGFWTHRDGLLTLNSGVDPRADPRVYTVAVRDDVVASGGKSHLTFRDLAVDESARADAGYGFRVAGGEGVRLEGCEAYRCGKHHFGVINTTGFVGVDLYAAEAMPDQGVGGASAYVSYSDRSRRGDTSHYLRCVAERPEDAGAGGRYPAFVTHGEGIGSVVLEGMTSRGGDLALGNRESGATIRVEGGRLEDAVLGVYGERIVVDGLTVVGPHAGVTLDGAGNVLQNMLMTGINPGSSGHQAAITEGGERNTVRFCTVVLDPHAPDFDAALSLRRPGGRLRWYGNVMVTTGTAVRAWFTGFEPAGYEADANFYNRNARFDTRYDGRGSLGPLAAWQSRGLDAHSLQGDPKFVDPANGDYSLAADSPAIDAAPPDPDPAKQVPKDHRGRPRPAGRAPDMGAFETQAPPPR